MSSTSRPTRRTMAALLALTLLAVACGSRVSAPTSPDDAAAAPPARSSGPAATVDLDADVTEPPEPVEDPAPVAATDAPAEAAADETAAEEDAPPRTVAREPTAGETDPAGDDAGRRVEDNAWTPFAAVEGVVLHHPSTRVERVGFHQANHDGARQLEILDGARAPMTLETRDRATGDRTAADVVVDPEVEIRAPVTGTVVRAGTYVLYCDYADDYVVVEPDARPGWEVKLLHIDGVRVAAGQRVVAGETVLAPRPTPLPFASQIDEYTAEPSWPHVHIEVVDPSIPNESSGGGC